MCVALGEALKGVVTIGEPVVYLLQLNERLKESGGSRGVAKVWKRTNWWSEIGGDRTRSWRAETKLKARWDMECRKEKGCNARWYVRCLGCIWCKCDVDRRLVERALCKEKLESTLSKKKDVGDVPGLRTTRNSTSHDQHWQGINRFQLLTLKRYPTPKY